MRHLRSLLAAAALGTLAVPVAAQTLVEACEVVGSMSVGQWAAYRATVPDMGRDPLQMRFAIVGTETVGGAPHYWHETQMAGSQGRMIMQILVPSYPFESEQIRGLIMKAGDQPAMRMPERMISMMMERAGSGGDAMQAAAANCAGAELVGREAVTTPAGTFDALHVRATAGGQADIWVALDVPFGIVRMQGQDGFSLELVDHGTDARSAITETPMTMPGG